MPETMRGAWISAAAVLRQVEEAHALFKEAYASNGEEDAWIEKQIAFAKNFINGTAMIAGEKATIDDQVVVLIPVSIVRQIHEIFAIDMREKIYAKTFHTLN